MQPAQLRHLALILLGLASGLLMACSGPGPGSVAAAPAPPLAARQTSAGITNAPASQEGFTVSGPLIVEHQLDLLAQREGVVAKLFSGVGVSVDAGNLLAELDDRQLTADLEAARAKTQGTEAELKSWQAEAKVLKSDYDRAQKLWDAQQVTAMRTRFCLSLLRDSERPS